ncbi:hypothetical protein JCM6882_005854 [Rhodosporidiobolus microsporus]
MPPRSSAPSTAASSDRGDAAGHSGLSDEDQRDAGLATTTQGDDDEPMRPLSSSSSASSSRLAHTNAAFPPSSSSPPRSPGPSRNGNPPTAADNEDSPLPSDDSDVDSLDGLDYSELDAAGLPRFRPPVGAFTGDMDEWEGEGVEVEEGEEVAGGGGDLPGGGEADAAIEDAAVEEEEEDSATGQGVQPAGVGPRPPTAAISDVQGTAPVGMALPAPAAQ